MLIKSVLKCSRIRKPMVLLRAMVCFLRLVVLVSIMITAQYNRLVKVYRSRHMRKDYAFV